MTKKTKSERVLAHLQTGRDLTEGQARQRFGIGNMSAEATRFRARGFAVYRNRKTLSNGNRVATYRLGTPTRAVVAAGYRALSARG